MTYDDDKSHFSMWCMMLSPLLAGNDLRTMSKETIEILTNREMIAIHQDEACIQAERKLKEGSVEVWVKPLGKAAKKEYAVAVLNRGDNPATYTLSFADLGVKGFSKARDVWQHKNVSVASGKITLDIPTHGIVVLRVKGK